MSRDLIPGMTSELSPAGFVATNSKACLRDQMELFTAQLLVLLGSCTKWPLSVDRSSWNVLCSVSLSSERGLPVLTWIFHSISKFSRGS